MAAPYTQSPPPFVASPVNGTTGAVPTSTASNAAATARRGSLVPTSPLEGFETHQLEGRYPTIGRKDNLKERRPHTEPVLALNPAVSADRAILKNTSLPLQMQTLQQNGWLPGLGEGVSLEDGSWLAGVGSMDDTPARDNNSDGPPLAPSGLVGPGSSAGPDSFAERYGLDDSLQARSPSASDDRRPQRSSSLPSTKALVPNRAYNPTSQLNSAPLGIISAGAAPITGLSGTGEALVPRAPSTHRTGIGAGMRASMMGPTSPIVPLSASPSYTPPVSSQPRAYAQQPTLSYVPVPAGNGASAAMYIGPGTPGQDNLNPNGSGSRRPPPSPQVPQARQPQEEVCVECAMRDADMADVDVTTPGIWERDSDVHFADLVQREEMEMREGKRPGHDGRPTSRGIPLTEANLKIWLTMNPKEPQARQQTLDLYVKTQSALLEAEAIARERAMRESRQLDNTLRDQYAQLRRSAYDLGASHTTSPSTANANEVGLNASASGSLRVKGPRSSSTNTALPATFTVPGREVVVQENGLIVEHVDVRREEREERERRRQERKRERSRAASNSRRASGSLAGASGVLGQDVTTSSTYSVIGNGGATSPVPGAHPDSGFFTHAHTHEHQRSTSQYSQPGSSIAQRPSSLAGGPPTSSKLTVGSSPNGNLYMHPSVSSAQSVGSSQLSPNRRSRFMDFKSWNTPWMSRDSLAPSGMSGFSGSMIDMHVALDNEKNRSPLVAEFSAPPQSNAVDLNSAAPTLRERWPQSPPTPDEASEVTATTPGKPKKMKGLKKMWKIVTGSHSKSDSNLLRNSPVPREKMPESSLDDMPLAPPPPISYLVNRNLGDRAVGQPLVGSRNMSTSSANRPLSSSTGFSPQTAPSSSLPSPTSSRILWPQQERDSFDTKKNGIPDIELDGLPPTIDEEGGHYSSYESGTPKTLYPIASEPDLRRQSFLGPTMLPPSALSSESRPKSIYMLDKALPPIPPPANVQLDADTPVRLTPGIRLQQSTSSPITFAQQGSASYSSSSTYQTGLVEPRPSFRAIEGRRSSFDVAPRPRLAPTSSHTMPAGNVGRPLTVVGGAEFDDFALARHRSNLNEYRSSTSSPTPQLAKRRSKFSLGALIGGKKNNRANANAVVNANTNMNAQINGESVGHQKSASRTSGSQYEFSGGAPLTAVTSRGKVLDDLVQQDRDFVAYRYPSRDDRLDLLQT